MSFDKEIFMLLDYTIITNFYIFYFKLPKLKKVCYTGIIDI